jgi:hypothetical protein
MNTEVNQEERWRKLLIEFKTQDKTIKSYCEMNDVKVHQFTYWRNKIEKGIVRKKKSKSSFIKITTVNNEQTSKDIPMIIEVNKIKINVPTNFNHLALTELIRVVQAID